MMEVLIIVDEYAKNSRIHVIHQENDGLSVARNSRIDWAFDNHYTNWIAFIDIDDLIIHNYLKVLLENTR